MGYGDPRGMAELRQALKQMLSMERFMNVAEDEICIVRGSQMEFSCLSSITQSAGCHRR